MDKTKVHTDAQKSSKRKAFDLMDYIGKIGVYQVKLVNMIKKETYFGIASLNSIKILNEVEHF